MNQPHVSERASARGSIPGLAPIAKTKRVTPGIPEPIARQLLKLLSTDDAFRKRFAKNPALGLLEAAGVAPQAATCLRTIKLASKRDIAKAHDDLLSMLTGTLAQQPVGLDCRR